MRLNKQLIFLYIFGLSTAWSVIQLSRHTLDVMTHPQGMPLHALSEQFTGLQGAFKNVPRAGYYSDKNMDIPVAIAQFEQAQFVLAPTVLELNNTNLPLIIFDCTSAQVALDKIKELKLTPISASSTGIILAINPKGFNS